ncbi:hypothetical protein K469DRAFT_81903 [Zopfia rhizophila CBS 207.26]|uniref:Uncharacterized protein n=1 Tax=Zopfia rhizophila CBS 207.26 TaxID=1314779 RepID=A0A6A6ED76_9PEZI|nr:hypothetical protein K469DRAFT_81903 [Zopfia rhizophila CBS 207.26]
MATYAETTSPLSARALFITITVVTTALRVYTRIAVLKQCGWEDWCMCFATVSIAYTHVYTNSIHTSEARASGNLRHRRGVAVAWFA